MSERNRHSNGGSRQVTSREDRDRYRSNDSRHQQRDNRRQEDRHASSGRQSSNGQNNRGTDRHHREQSSHRRAETTSSTRRSSETSSQRRNSSSTHGRSERSRDRSTRDTRQNPPLTGSVGNNTNNTSHSSSRSHEQNHHSTNGRSHRENNDRNRHASRNDQNPSRSRTSNGARNDRDRNRDARTSLNNERVSQSSRRQDGPSASSNNNESQQSVEQNQKTVPPTEAKEATKDPRKQSASNSSEPATETNGNPTKAVEQVDSTQGSASNQSNNNINDNTSTEGFQETLATGEVEQEDVKKPFTNMKGIVIFKTVENNRVVYYPSDNGENGVSADSEVNESALTSHPLSSLLSEIPFNQSANDIVSNALKNPDEFDAFSNNIEGKESWSKRYPSAFAQSVNTLNHIGSLLQQSSSGQSVTSSNNEIIVNSSSHYVGNESLLEKNEERQCGSTSQQSSSVNSEPSANLSSHHDRSRASSKPKNSIETSSVQRSMRTNSVPTIVRQPLPFPMFQSNNYNPFVRNEAFSNTTEVKQTGPTSQQSSSGAINSNQSNIGLVNSSSHQAGSRTSSMPRNPIETSLPKTNLPPKTVATVISRPFPFPPNLPEDTKKKESSAKNIKKSDELVSTSASQSIVQKKDDRSIEDRTEQPSSSHPDRSIGRTLDQVTTVSKGFLAKDSNRLVSTSSTPAASESSTQRNAVQPSTLLENNSNAVGSSTPISLPSQPNLERNVVKPPIPFLKSSNALGTLTSTVVSSQPKSQGNSVMSPTTPVKKSNGQGSLTSNSAFSQPRDQGQDDKEPSTSNSTSSESDTRNNDVKAPITIVKNFKSPINPVNNSTTPPAVSSGSSNQRNVVQPPIASLMTSNGRGSLNSSSSQPNPQRNAVKPSIASVRNSNGQRSSTPAISTPSNAPRNVVNSPVTPVIKSNGQDSSSASTPSQPNVHRNAVHPLVPSVRNSTGRGCSNPSPSQTNSQRNAVKPPTTPVTNSNSQCSSSSASMSSQPNVHSNPVQPANGSVEILNVPKSSKSKVKKAQQGNASNAVPSPALAPTRNIDQDPHFLLLERNRANLPTFRTEINRSQDPPTRRNGSQPSRLRINSNMTNGEQKNVVTFSSGQQNKTNVDGLKNNAKELKSSTTPIGFIVHKITKEANNSSKEKNVPSKSTNTAGLKVTDEKDSNHLSSNSKRSISDGDNISRSSPQKSEIIGESSTDSKRRNERSKEKKVTSKKEEANYATDESSQSAAARNTPKRSASKMALTQPIEDVNPIESSSNSNRKKKKKTDSVSTDTVDKSSRNSMIKMGDMMNKEELDVGDDRKRSKVTVKKFIRGLLDDTEDSSTSSDSQTKFPITSSSSGSEADKNGEGASSNIGSPPEFKTITKEVDSEIKADGQPVQSKASSKVKKPKKPVKSALGKPAKSAFHSQNIKNDSISEQRIVSQEEKFTVQDGIVPQFSTATSTKISEEVEKTKKSKKTGSAKKEIESPKSTNSSSFDPMLVEEKLTSPSNKNSRSVTCPFAKVIEPVEKHQDLPSKPSAKKEKSEAKSKSKLEGIEKNLASSLSSPVIVSEENIVKKVIPNEIASAADPIVDLPEAPKKVGSSTSKRKRKYSREEESHNKKYAEDPVILSDIIESKKGECLDAKHGADSPLKHLEDHLLQPIEESKPLGLKVMSVSPEKEKVAGLLVEIEENQSVDRSSSYSTESPDSYLGELTTEPMVTAKNEHEHTECTEGTKDLRGADPKSELGSHSILEAERNNEQQKEVEQIPDDLVQEEIVPRNIFMAQVVVLMEPTIEQAEYIQPEVVEKEQTSPVVVTPVADVTQALNSETTLAYGVQIHSAQKVVNNEVSEGISDSGIKRLTKNLSVIKAVKNKKEMRTSDSRGNKRSGSGYLMEVEVPVKKACTVDSWLQQRLGFVVANECISPESNSKSTPRNDAVKPDVLQKKDNVNLDFWNGFNQSLYRGTPYMVTESSGLLGLPVFTTQISTGETPSKHLLPPVFLQSLKD